MLTLFSSRSSNRVICPVKGEKEGFSLEAAGQDLSFALKVLEVSRQSPQPLEASGLFPVVPSPRHSTLHSTADPHIGYHQEKIHSFKVNSI